MTIPPPRRNRMLLLQDTMAKKLNAELDGIEVGVYDFVAGQHYATKFKPSQIRGCPEEIVRSAQRIWQNNHRATTFVSP